MQLPPVPAAASLTALVRTQSYDQLQGGALLAGIEYVNDFAEMNRFDVPMLVDVLQGMRVALAVGQLAAAGVAMQLVQLGAGNK